MKFALFALTVAGSVGCLAPTSDDDANNEGLVLPDFKDGLALTNIAMRGALEFEAPAMGNFVADNQLEGYEIGVAAGATARLEITQAGSTRALDTTMFVYGPKANGEYPEQPILVDNDSGWAKFSRITGTAEQAGTYLVVIGTRVGTGTSSRGKYRLLATCRSGDTDACAWTAPVAAIPLGQCPAALQGAISACVESWLDDSYEGTTSDLVDQCSDAEVLAPTYDAACGVGNAPSWCLGSLETTYLTYAAPCARDVKHTLLNATCTLGSTYYEMKQLAHLVPLREQTLTSAAGLSSIERQQVVSAMHASSNTDVTTAAQAIAAADQGEMIRIFWWDTSNRKAYVSYEYGAGDNSYGRIFFYGTVTAVTSIGDGDLYDCTTYVGLEQRACTSTVDCAAGLQCVGIAEASGFGSCVATGADESPPVGNSCSATTFCGFTSGLACAGLSRGNEGMCLPAWMRKTFIGNFGNTIPDNNAAGTSAQIVVSGLATVDMDVWLAVEISHSRRTDLKVYLKNPAGTEVLVAEPTEAGEDLWIDVPVLGFSGDESVNGIWTIRVVDKKSSKKGTFNKAKLTVGSRWD